LLLLFCSVPGGGGDGKGGVGKVLIDPVLLEGDRPMFSRLVHWTAAVSGERNVASWTHGEPPTAEVCPSSIFLDAKSVAKNSVQ
jgi:hypothetical protein